MAEIKAYKWLLTINNPDDKGFTKEIIEETLKEFKSFRYACYSYENGKKTQTKHVHIFVVFDNQVRFDTIKNKFEPAHIDKCRGTVKENKEYVFKCGKWSNTEKEDTRLEGMQFEIGEEPYEVGQGKRCDIDYLYQLIKEGKSNYEIFEIDPQYINHINYIDKARIIINAENSKNKWRDLQVYYISGEPGIGKTRAIMEYYGYTNVYKINDYEHPFDNYNNEDIILFDEFRNGIRVNDMLAYLDGYPVQLQCRYYNKYANYTKVFFTSNWRLEEQYSGIQINDRMTYNALMRRINHVLHVKNEKSIIDMIEGKIIANNIIGYDTNEFIRIDEQIKLPFAN